jgi:hypothetical protein
MPSSTSPRHCTVPGTQNGKLGRTGFGKDFAGLEASVVAVLLLVKMILFETVVRVLEELAAFQIRVANNSNRLRTFALVAAEVLRLVTRVVVGVNGEKKTVTSVGIFGVITIDMSVCLRK